MAPPRSSTIRPTGSVGLRLSAMLTYRNGNIQYTHTLWYYCTLNLMYASKVAKRLMLRIVLWSCLSWARGFKASCLKWKYPFTYNQEISWRTTVFIIWVEEWLFYLYDWRLELFHYPYLRFPFFTFICYASTTVDETKLTCGKEDMIWEWERLPGWRERERVPSLAGVNRPSWGPQRKDHCG